MLTRRVESCYILNTYSGEYLNFQFMPDFVYDRKEAIWEQTPIILRSEPIQGYAYSGARTISLDLRFFCEEDPYKDIKEKVDFIRSLTYPIYDKTVKSPPLVVIRIGELISSRCYVSSYSFTYAGPWDLNTMYCYDAMVGLTFIEVNTTPYGHTVVRRGRDKARAL